MNCDSAATRSSSAKEISRRISRIYSRLVSVSLVNSCCHRRSVPKRFLGICARNGNICGCQRSLTRITRREYTLCTPAEKYLFCYRRSYRYRVNWKWTTDTWLGSNRVTVETAPLINILCSRRTKKCHCRQTRYSIISRALELKCRRTCSVWSDWLLNWWINCCRWYSGSYYITRSICRSREDDTANWKPSKKKRVIQILFITQRIPIYYY